jgi:glycosyltransferase involved in cell wall biosynthesis
MTPRISIIIPAYNAARWLGQTIKSALDQTWPAKEIIVVDDGSRDDTLAVAGGFVSAGVRVLTQQNRGASAARNTGLGFAQGEYIQFLDADDLLAPNKLEEQVQLLQERGGTHLSSSAWARFVHHPAEAIFTVQPNWRDLSGVEFLQLHYEAMCMMQPAAWLAHRSVIDRVGPWNESLSLNDDGEYFARVALAAGQIVFCRQARSFYRSELRDSLSQRKDHRALKSLYESVELTVGHLLAADQSPRTLAAAAFAWKWAAFELYPGAPELSLAAESKSKKLGGSPRPFPGSGRFRVAAALLGWRNAKRLLSP